MDSRDSSKIGGLDHDGPQLSEQVMVQRVKARLETLTRELAIGKNELTEVERRRAYLGETMLRISGAILVLEELLREAAERRLPDLDRVQSADTVIGTDK